MFANSTLTFQQLPDRRRAVTAFESAYHQGVWDRIRAAITGQAHRLLSLPERLGAQHFAGAQVVPVAQIQGTEERSEDFDADFHPLNQESQDRWVSIYSAWQRGQHLPPVELIQVGSTYYVRDGHHRVSVARALGQDYVDAVVISVGPRPLL